MGLKIEKSEEPKVPQLRYAVLDTWTESERGWGSRPDGATLHLTMEDYGEYVEEYWGRMPKGVPDEYSRPDASPRNVVIEEDLYQKIVASRNGIRLWQGEYSKMKAEQKIIT